MLDADPLSGPDVRFRLNFVLASLACGAVLAALFLSHPQIDIAFSTAMREACGGDARHSGWCHENEVLSLPRYLAIAFSAACIAVATYVLLRSLARYGRPMGIEKVRSLVLLATFAAGPGLLANVVLKDNWGRARPREVIEFGGKKAFTAPLIPARECADNCSFISGEAASVYAPFFAAALLFPQARIALVMGGLATGTATGLVRIGTGGHFLSDVLFAGVFMALIAALVHVVIIGLWTRRRTHGPLPAQRPAWLHISIIEGSLVTSTRRHQ